MEINLGLFTFMFLAEPLPAGVAYAVGYSLPLVAASYIFAFGGSYVGLVASEQVRISRNRLEAFAWLAAGAVAMAAGVWSMHFVGMLSMRLPVNVHYDLLLTTLSIIPAVLASFLALSTLSAKKVSALRLAISSLLLGAGIGAMHFLGMGAMHTNAAMGHDPLLFAVSIGLAVAFAYVALSAKFRLKGWQQKQIGRWINPISGGIMGLAISAMHYTAMSSVQFFGGDSHGNHGAEVDVGFLIVMIGAVVFMLLFLVFTAILARKTYANTMLKQTQAALAEAEGRWNFALQGSGQGVWDYQATTKEMYYSPTWRNMRGFGADEEIDSDVEVWLSRVHPGDRDRIRDIIRRQDSGEIPHNFFEYRERHRDGHYLWIQSRGEPVSWDEQGAPTRIIGVDIDVTMRKELELQVSENLHVLNSTLENFPGGICMFDKKLVLTVANRGFYDITQLDENWFPTGSKLEDIFRFHAERGEYGGGDIDTQIAERIADVQINVAKKYSRTRPQDGATLEFSRTPLEQGGFVMTVEDITLKMAADQERAQLERDLSQAQKMESLGTLASGVAHEINTPIQYVGDNIRFLQESFADLAGLLEDYRKAGVGKGDDPAAAALADKEEEIDLEFLLEELPQSMEQSLEGIGHVARIVNAIKEFSHPGQDEKAAIDLNATIETTLTVSRNQWKYVAELNTDLSADLPLITCYQGDINQVILNMVVNAAHAIEASGKSENGQITVSTRLADGFAEIEIADNGSGMSDEVRSRIFDPFFTTKDVGKGTGQGLAISYAIIHQKHGGTIDCSSEPGTGTRFKIRLPLEESAPAAELVA